MKTQRDELASLLYATVDSMPEAGLAEQCDALASVALTFQHLAGSDARLAAKHRNIRERVLLHGLAQALKVVEQHDLSASLRIVDEIVEAVEPLSGEPLDLNTGRG
jgi:hypothetical protein